ncbi:MAG: glycosyltransferase family protein [Myxococcales bacterium]
MDTALIVTPEYPPWAGPDGAAAAAVRRAAALDRRGCQIEILAPGPDGEEFMHLDERGRLVHRVCSERSYLRKGLGVFRLELPLGNGALGVRMAERIAELELLWGRRFVELHVLGSNGSVAALPTRLRRSAAAPLARPAAAPLGSVDVICPGVGVPDLARSLRSLLPQIDELRGSGVAASVTVVHSRPELPSELAASLPQLEGDDRVRFVPSAPGLWPMRSAGLARTEGDLVVFLGAEVNVQPGFLRAHLQAAQANPRAMGIAGRVRRETDGYRATWFREVGQLRSTGFLERNYDTLTREPRLVAQLPPAPNLSLRRAATTALLGRADWFDGREGPSLEIFRRGGYFAYEPDAALDDHGPDVFEAAGLFPRARWLRARRADGRLSGTG